LSTVFFTFSVTSTIFHMIPFFLRVHPSGSANCGAIFLLNYEDICFVMKDWPRYRYQFQFPFSLTLIPLPAQRGQLYISFSSPAFIFFRGTGAFPRIHPKNGVAVRDGAGVGVFNLHCLVDPKPGGHKNRAGGESSTLPSS